MGNLVQSAREVHDSVIVEGGNPKSVRWKDQVKDAVKRKEAAWKETNHFEGN